MALSDRILGVMEGRGPEKWSTSKDVRQELDALYKDRAPHYQASVITHLGFLVNRGLIEIRTITEDGTPIVPPEYTIGHEHYSPNDPPEEMIA